MAGFKYLNDDIPANDSHVPIKITTGTGFNIQTNIGNEMVIDENSLTSLAFTSDKENIYALECLNSFAGGTISWLKNNLKLIETASESEIYSKKEKVSDIHIDPKNDSYKIRILKDGVSQKFISMSKESGIKFWFSSSRLPLVVAQ